MPTDNSIFLRVLSTVPALLFLATGCSTPKAATVPAASGEPVATEKPTQAAAVASAATFTPTDEPSTTETATPPWGCSQAKGTLEMATMETDLQKWPVDMRVFLPPCYDPARRPGYPLLIIIHGQTYNYDQWDRDGMDEAADRLTAAGTIQPMIIVMPNEADTERDPQQSNFDEVVADAVLPWVDGHYNTCTERFCRAVGGLSRGATWAMHIGMLKPELFGSIGAHSFTPFIGDVYRLKYWLMNTDVKDLPRFYLDMGSEDRPEHIAAINQYRAEMDRLGIAYEWHWNSGGHDDAYWSAHVEEYLLWYAEAWSDLAW
jgi:enterochelin esterase-like enzyme